MKSKPVIPRKRAVRDVEEVIEFYVKEDAADAALVFVDALQKAYEYLGRHPEAGSSRYAAELGLAGLRFWRLKKYPHLVFYLERSDHIDVWRVLHGERDIPGWMQEPDLV